MRFIHRQNQGLHAHIGGIGGSTESVTAIIVKVTRSRGTVFIVDTHFSLVEQLVGADLVNAECITTSIIVICFAGFTQGDDRRAAWLCIILAIGTIKTFGTCATAPHVA